eukprot:TRINITY_DN57366_c0_g1_i1.p1 TRINITY_DN57366_c0_g1~~TRINITY_DN57366_c0_g1_i1.p1  ORF type:complete len:421 (+),score=53.13 TRINITY_DN57366_c0_g1_i1:56-1318(+)
MIGNSQDDTKHSDAEMDAKRLHDSWSWKEWFVGILPGLTFLVFEGCMFMLTLYAGKCYLAVSEGDTSSKPYCIAASICGIMLAALPLAALFLPSLAPIWFDWAACCSDMHIRKFCSRITTACLHMAFVMTLFVLLMLVVTTATQLQDIQTTLRLQADCLDGSLLEVQELLTYKMKGGSATQARRSLMNQVEPSMIRALAVGNAAGPSNVRIANAKRRESGKTDFNYESGQVTDVHIEFDSFLNPGNNSLQLWLVYNARLHGKPGCNEGGSVCSDSPGFTRVEGQWLVDRGDVSGDLQLGTCGSNSAEKGDCALVRGNLSGYKASVSHNEGNTWNINLRLPESLRVGSEACPLAWEVPDRNVFWVVGAGLLFVAGAICCGALQVSGHNEGSALFVAFACALCFLIAAIVFFGLALFSDFIS